MNLIEIVAKFGSLTVQEKRELGEEKAEFVIMSNDMPQWDKLFTELLGSAIKPAGIKPTSEQSTWAKPYGGIFDTQIMYKKDFDGYYILAMFWPWGNGTQSTLKLAFVKV